MTNIKTGIVYKLYDDVNNIYVGFTSYSIYKIQSINYKNYIQYKQDKSPQYGEVPIMYKILSNDNHKYEIIETHNNILQSDLSHVKNRYISKFKDLGINVNKLN